MPCHGKVWVGWKWTDCKREGSVRLGDCAYCPRCYAEATIAKAGQVAATQTQPDESAIARDQLAARLAGRIAERMGWSSVAVGDGCLRLTPEQAVELVERLE